MNYASPKQRRINRIATRTQKTLLPLVAVGGSLAGLPASALELGDMTVQSRLGQPLRASIAYALAPHEQLSSTCVTLAHGATSSGLPGIGRATLSIADGTILLTGQTPIREPMVAAQIKVDCAYTPNLSREYLMFIDPASRTFDEPATVQAPAVTAPVAARRPQAVAARRSPVAARSESAPIGTASRYRVQPGDSLSRIAARIENRPVGLWPAVNAIFAANPDAFINDDMDRLKAGSWLTIPSFDGSKPVINQPVVNSAVERQRAPSASAATDLAADATNRVEEIAPIDEYVAPRESAPAAMPEAVATDATSDLSDVTATRGDDNPFVDGAEIVGETVIIPDTEIEGPETASASPNVVTAVVNNTPEAEASSSWLLWLAGSGIALIAGLLLFGRLFRNRPLEPLETPAADHPARRVTDQESGGLEVTAHFPSVLDDESPTEENLSLDADLVLGTGLDEGTDMEVAQDFGFAATTEVDLELPFEPEPSVDQSDTGIFLAADEDDDETVVLDRNSSSDDEDEYDFSVILDATKMPQPEDITQRDLNAIEVSPTDENDQTGSYTGSYTIADEVGLEILEKDYEDEFTATQALNAELARAAAEVTESRDSSEENDDYEVTSEMTAGLPLSSIAEMDATSELPLQGFEKDDVDTDIHAAITVEMPAAENDETAEIELEGGTVDTKVV